jgi:osmotically-inducible protein OsmY
MNALEQNIMEALAGNPRVDPDEISVGEAFGGDVMLRGTVGSVVRREEAVRTTRHVTGDSNAASSRNSRGWSG